MNDIMTLKDAVEALLQRSNKSKTQFAEALGYRSASAVNNILRRGNVTLDNLIAMCDELGYEVVLEPSDRRGKRPAGQITLQKGGTEK